MERACNDSRPRSGVEILLMENVLPEEALEQGSSRDCSALHCRSAFTVGIRSRAAATCRRGRILFRAGRSSNSSDSGMERASGWMGPWQRAGAKTFFIAVFTA